MLCLTHTWPLTWGLTRETACSSSMSVSWAWGDQMIPVKCSQYCLNNLKMIQFLPHRSLITAIIGIPHKSSRCVCCVCISELWVGTVPSWLMRWDWGRPSRAWHCPGHCWSRGRMVGSQLLSVSLWLHLAALCRTGVQSLTSGWAARGSVFSQWIRWGGGRDRGSPWDLKAYVKIIMVSSFLKTVKIPHAHSLFLY